MSRGNFRALVVICGHDVEPGEALRFDGYRLVVREVVRLKDGAVYRCKNDDGATVYVENGMPLPKKKLSKKATNA